MGCLNDRASCPIIWGDLSYKYGASCLGPTFYWGELFLGELSIIHCDVMGTGASQTVYAMLLHFFNDITN